MKLTQAIIKRAQYEGRQYRGKDGKPKATRCVLWDDEVRGLGLRITPAGRKTFIVSYRIGSRKRLMTLGPYGVVTLDGARRKAKRALGKVLEGEDPLAERQKKLRGETVEELSETYLAEHAVPKKKPQSVMEDRRMLKSVILPALGRQSVQDLSRADVARLHHGLRGTPYQANRVLALLSKMMNLAERWGMREDGTNPCRHIEKYKEKARRRYLTATELRRLGKVIDQVEREGKEPPEAAAAVRLLILTGCRLSEILTLKWEFVDFERGVLQLPDSKTGAKEVPLGAAAIEVLVELPRLEGNPYVLPGRRDGSHLTDMWKIWNRIRETAGLEDVRLHDLRHSFASVGVSAGMGLPVIGALLGHAEAATTQRYAHLADDPLKRAADQISGEIAGAMSGKEAEVVPIRDRRGGGR